MGILGGAFNPIHLGHIQIAKTVLASGTVDEVWVLPCYKHMFDKQMASAEHRFKMCELACDGFENIKASSYEIDNKFDGKAIDFVNNFLNKNFSPDQYHFKFIIGMNNALKIDKWYKSEELRKSIGFIVVPRIGEKTPGIRRWFESFPHIWIPKPVMDISSTKIRNWIAEHGKNGVAISAPYINIKVAEYIKEHNLYGLGDNNG